MIIDLKRVNEAKQYCVAELPPCQIENGLRFINELVDFEHNWDYFPKSGALIKRYGLNTSFTVEILDILGTFYNNDVLIFRSAYVDEIKIIKK